MYFRLSPPRAAAAILCAATLAFAVPADAQDSTAHTAGHMMKGQMDGGMPAGMHMMQQGDGTSSGDHHGAVIPAAIGTPGDVKQVDRTIRVELTTFAFKPMAIDVKPGETIRFILVNSTDILHEFNIGTEQMHAAHRQEMAAMMQSGMLTATEMKMPDMKEGSGGMDMDHDDPNSVIVPPGKTAELVWKFPMSVPADGKLYFACNFPGHSESGMIGPFRYASN